MSNRLQDIAGDTKRMLDDACDTKRVMGTRYRGLQRDTPVHVKAVTRTDAAAELAHGCSNLGRPDTQHSRAVLVAAAKRRTRRVAGSIERRRRHERGVVVPTSERDLHGRVSRSRRGYCRARGCYCTSQANCRGEHAGAACEPTPRSRPSTPPAALTLCAARLAGMAPCPLR